MGRPSVFHDSCWSQAFVHNTKIKGTCTFGEVIREYHASPFLHVFGRFPLKLTSNFERFQKRAHLIICAPCCSCERFLSLSSNFEEAAVKLLLVSEANCTHVLHDFCCTPATSVLKPNKRVCAKDCHQNFFLWNWSSFQCSALFYRGSRNSGARSLAKLRTCNRRLVSKTGFTT